MIDKPTRGERNNNPGNLRHGEPWHGLAPDQPDADFCTFSEPEDGIRALAKNLLNYQLRHGLNTVTQIVERWAPPNENDTNAYVNSVASKMGVGPDAPLDLKDPVVLEDLTAAIIKHENGRIAYPWPTIVAAVDDALGVDRG